MVVSKKEIGNCTAIIDDEFCRHLTPDSPEVKRILDNIAKIIVNDYRAAMRNGEIKV